MKICSFDVGREEFKQFKGRYPRKGELQQYAHNIKNGIDAQLDWDMLYSSAIDGIGEE